MKKLITICCLVCMLALSPAVCGADAAPLPFTIDDINAVTQNLRTVADYAELIQPNAFSWMYAGGDAGETLLEFMDADGELILSIRTGATGIDGEEYGTSDTLDGAVLALDAELVSAIWFESRYPLPVVRDVGIGASRQAVLDSFLNKGLPMYGVADIDPAADAGAIPDWAYVGADIFPADEDSAFERIIYGWCDLRDPDPCRKYYTLSYEMQDDAVFTIELFALNGDAEESADGPDGF